MQHGTLRRVKRRLQVYLSGVMLEAAAATAHMMSSSVSQMAGQQTCRSKSHAADARAENGAAKCCVTILHEP
jgi:hypothetical protein